MSSPFDTAAFDTANPWAPLWVGPGYGTPVEGRAVTPDPRSEMVPAVPGAVFTAPARALPPTVDELCRGVDWPTCDRMAADPQCSGSFNTLRMAILAGGLSFLPAIYGATPKVNDDGPDAKEAAEAAAFCSRAVAGMADAFAADWALLEGMPEGHKLGEVVLRDAEAGGPDEGLLTLDRINVKPRGSLSFVVDPAMNVTGILAWTTPVGPGGSVAAGGKLERTVLDPAKFARFTWMPRDNDPRGTSLFHAARAAWHLKIRTWPEYYRYLQQWGTPSIKIVASPDANPSPPADPETGLPIPGAPLVYPEQANLRIGQSFQNSSIASFPAGTLMDVIQAAGNGEAFLKGIDLFDRQIVFAIMGQVRATMEAQHGSKADSQGGADILGWTVRYGYGCRAATWHRVVKWLLAINKGDAYAAKNCPIVKCGDTEHHDFAANAAAVASLAGADYLEPEQLPEVDAMLGLPIRTADAVTRRAEAREAASDAADAAASPDDPQAADDDKPTNQRPTE